MSFLADRSAVSVGLGGVVSLTSGNTQVFNPASLFSGGEQGVWYDPSDLTTLYQDAAGTIAVTGMEQPVGKMLDKSGRGNHVTNVGGDGAPATRPTISARVNLLTKTEDFNDDAWAKDNAAITTGVTDPLGGTTAVTITATGTGVLHEVYQLSTGSGRTQTIWLRRRTGTGDVRSYVDDAYVNWGSLTSTWQQFSITQASASPSYFLIGLLSDGDAVDVWHPDLRVSNSGVNLPTYQRVNTSTDYDATGFPIYLKFNGTNTAMQSENTVDMTASDKVTVWNGVRKLAETAALYLVAIGTATSNGSFRLTSNYVAGTRNSPAFVSRGTSNSQASAISMAFPAPLSMVLCGIGDIGGDISAIRTNGSLFNQNAIDQGTGNYGNYTMYLGVRSDSLFYFNGYFYGAIVRGGQSTNDQVISGENYMNGKTKAY